MKKKTNSLSGQQGFSLVELLVVIAVIAIIAAIAIPNIANITSQASYAKSQRNAQSLVSVANAAIAAGYSGSAWGTFANMVDSLATTGSSITVTPPSGNTAQTMTFSISPLSPEEKQNLAPFVNWTGSTTFDYVSSGSQTTAVYSGS